MVQRKLCDIYNYMDAACSFVGILCKACEWITNEHGN